MTKAGQLKQLLTSRELSFIMEAHDGLSAKIVEEAGFKGIWGSGLCLSAAMGVRDNNEATWTQVLEVLEFMSDATTVPILLDGDTGYGNFNTLRRVIRKLEQRGVAGICIEDKLFPKTNSFIDGERQQLADIDEFAGKIKAAKNTQDDPDFCVVARVEAFIAGWGLGEALKRADAYHKAGADALLIHSKKNNPEDIVAFMKEWGDTCPVVIVPTKYYGTPTDVFRDLGVSMVIWANHLLRGAVKRMQELALTVEREESLVPIEDTISSVAEIFRLQGAEELREAEKLYLPKRAEDTNAVILAASKGVELEGLTRDMPKAMLPVQGKPLLYRAVDTFNDSGVKDITVVRGYRPETIDAPNLRFVDNPNYESSKEVQSLVLAREQIKENTVIAFGDILFKKHILLNLLESPHDLVVVVDSERTAGTRREGEYRDFVACDKPYNFFEEDARLVRMGNDLPDEDISGEWIGMMRVRDKGAAALCRALDALCAQSCPDMRMAGLLNHLVESGCDVRILYIQGHWLDVDNLDDYGRANIF